MHGAQDKNQGHVYRTSYLERGRRGLVAIDVDGGPWALVLAVWYRHLKGTAAGCGAA